jgi:hypothetical protein
LLFPIHFVLDPAYATEREQKRRVKKLRIGDRIRVTDGRSLFGHEGYGTVTDVTSNGEYFRITWDETGPDTLPLSFRDIDEIELKNPPN